MSNKQSLSLILRKQRCEGEAEAHKMFVCKRDRALAIVVLSVETSLLYIIGDPKDPVAVWKKLEDQFQKKTRANKLEMRRKLYLFDATKRRRICSEHIKEMTEALAMIGDPTCGRRRQSCASSG